MKTASGILLVFFLLMGAAAVPAAPAPREIVTLPPGSPMPAFDLPGIDGRNHTQDDFQEARLLVVVFLANHCPTVQAYEERLINMVEAYREQGVAFVAISPNSPNAVSLGELGYSDLGDTFEDMVLRAEHRGYNFPYLYDGDDHAVSLQFGPAATPHVFLFDEQRILRYAGRIDDTENPYVTPRTNDLRDAIETVLSGERIEVKATPTFGCSVKWAWNTQWKDRQLREWAARPVPLEMVNPDGIRRLVANDSGKLRLINVWATWCGPCLAKFPDLIETDRMYRGRAFELVTISADEPNRQERVWEFLRQQQASNQNYLFDGSDTKYALIEALDPAWQGALPYSILVSAEGEILHRYAGWVDPLVVRRDIINVLGRVYADDRR